MVRISRNVSLPHLHAEFVTSLLRSRLFEKSLVSGFFHGTGQTVFRKTYWTNVVFRIQLFVDYLKAIAVVMTDLAVLNVSARFNDFEPIPVPDSLARLRHGCADCFFNTCFG